MLSSIMCVVYICFVVLLFFAGFVFDLVDFRGSGGYFHFISYSRSTTTTTATTNSRKVFHSRVWDWKREKCHWPGTFPLLLSFLFIFHADHRSSLIPLINQLCVCVCVWLRRRPAGKKFNSLACNTHTHLQPYSKSNSFQSFRWGDSVSFNIQRQCFMDDISDLCYVCASLFFAMYNCTRQF